MIQVECNDCGGFASLRKTCNKCEGKGYREVEGKTEVVKTTSGDIKKSKKQIIPGSKFVPDGIQLTSIWDKRNLEEEE